MNSKQIMAAVLCNSRNTHDPAVLTLEILSALKEAGFVVVPVELLKRCEREFRYVVDDIEKDRVSIDGDAFHETLQDIRAMIAAQEEDDES